MTTITDQNGTEIDQGFDDLDRLTARELTLATGVGGDTDESFEYDAMNRLVEAADNDAIVQLTYDSLSRVLTEVEGSNPLGTTGKTVSYTWDAESNRDGAAPGCASDRAAPRAELWAGGATEFLSFWGPSPRGNCQSYCTGNAACSPKTCAISSGAPSPAWVANNPGHPSAQAHDCKCQ